MSITQISDLSDYTPNDKNEFYVLLNSMRELFWQPNEIAFHQDEADVIFRLRPEERNLLKVVLGFFAFADGLVAEADSSIFEKNIHDFYAKACYRFAAQMEDVHAETYNNTIDALFPLENQAIKEKVLKSPATLAKIQWMSKWMSNSATLGEKLVAFICIEGIFFSSSFASIFWFKLRGLCPGLIQSNELIVRDEATHVRLGQTAFNKLKITENYTHIIKEAVEVEALFARETCPVPIDDLNADRLIGYIQFIADQIAVKINYKKIYNVENKCLYMDNLGLLSKTSFFEQAAIAYRPISNLPDLKKLDQF